jgi:hypothetical protein
VYRTILLALPAVSHLKKIPSFASFKLNFLYRCVELPAQFLTVERKSEPPQLLCRKIKRYILPPFLKPHYLNWILKVYFYLNTTNYIGG